MIKLAEGSTLIGKSVLIRGEISGSEDLYLDGVFEGVINLPESRLTIGPNARISAEVHVRDFILFGRLDGNISATGRAELRQTAVVNGNVAAHRLSVEESATIHGRVELTGVGADGKPAEASPTV